MVQHLILKSLPLQWKESHDRVSQRTDTGLDINLSWQRDQKPPVTSPCADEVHAKTGFVDVSGLCSRKPVAPHVLTELTRIESIELVLPPPRQSPWKHIWRTDHGLDGERGYSSSQVPDPETCIFMLERYLTVHLHGHLHQTLV